MNKKNFEAIIDGKKVGLFTLVNDNNIRIDITNFGGRLITLNVPDKNWKLDDIILGYSSLSEYIMDNDFMGAIVGRYVIHTLIL